ncbi:arylsulfatase [Aquiflexum sp.]|uniref:arylsulfatase n=1 Tax=Aquiflexum sp. TaxID=1872584 RepID=UPI0035932E1B
MKDTHFVIVYIFFLLTSFLQSCQKAEKSQDQRLPNIIIIMADDMGYSDIGFFGAEIATPNIDQLAKNGLVMTQFYNTSRCCPSRTALLTGLYQHEAGIGNMVGDMGHPSYQGYLNEKCVTIAEALRSNGYTTLMSGKWHVGGERANWPRQRGFDRFFGFPSGGGVYFFPIRSGRQVILDDDPVPLDTANFYSTDAFTDYAIQFIDEHMASKETANAPFFLYLPHIAPHFPLQAREEDIQKYRGSYKEGFSSIRAKRYQKLKASGIVPEGFELTDPDDQVLDWNALSEAEKDTFDLKMSVYAAQMTSMDRGIGELVSRLREHEILDNTLIIFLSDNGGTHEAIDNAEFSGGPIGSRNSFVSYSRSWANVSNTPFRMYKHWVHEGGISTPLIMHYPAMIKEPKINHEVGHIMDIMPTLLELTQTEYPTSYKGHDILPLRGKSLLPLMEGNKREGHEYLFWEHQGNKAVRKANWKMVQKKGSGEWELYEMNIDRTELKDVSGLYPDVVVELEQKYNEWAADAGVLPWEEVESIRSN